MRKTKKNPFLSVVVPAYNEGATIQRFLPELESVLLGLTDKYEIIIVDDGSQDDTIELVKAAHTKQKVQLISFSRNFGKEPAITAGLSHAKGDAVIMIDADFQHPFDLIPKFVEKWQTGYDNVYGVRNRDNQSKVLRFFSNAFYKLNKVIMNIDLPPDAGDFRLLDRKVVDAINTLPEVNRFMKGLYAWVGFKGFAIPYEVQAREEGKSRWGYFRLFELALTGITSFSDWPLRMSAMLGLVISFISFIYGLFIILDTLFFGVITPGWSTLIVVIMFLGGVQLLSIGILGEYIGRIFNEVKSRPKYVVNDEDSTIES